MSPDHLDTVIYWSNTRVSGTLSCHVVRVHHFVHGVYTWGGGGFSGGLIFGWSWVEVVNHTDQLRKISPRGIHFYLKEGHLEGHIALSKVDLQKKKKKKKKKRSHIFFVPKGYNNLGIIFRKHQLDLLQPRYNFRKP